MFWGLIDLEFLKKLNIIPAFKSPVNIVFDLLIVSFLIYQFYSTIRRTRGIQLLFGIAAIWVAGSIAEFLELELLDWLIDNIKPALVFAVIVLLQPELRKITADLSKLKFMRPFLVKPLLNLDVIIEAVRELSKKKTGSIIIIMREHNLKEIIDQAVLLDAVLSTNLLLTIFKKNSALHDGAVILEQNRILCASAFIPMSTSPKVTHLGARHRAALGLSEESDAITIVTSEETGEISLCANGDIIHPVKILELKNKIKNLLNPGLKKSNKSIKGKIKSLFE